MQKALGNAIKSLLEGNGWKKLSAPTVKRGNTALPRNPSAVERIGLRLDYDDTVEKDGNTYHKFKLQVNAGNKIPSSFKQWRDAQSRGTHSIMAKVMIKDGATKEEIETVLKEATKDI